MHNNILAITCAGSVVDAVAPEKDATDLSIFTGGPKLEDFLGGSTATPGAAPPLSHFSNESPANVTTTVSSQLPVHHPDVYDSELKTIAASFLRGFSTEQQTQPQNQHVTPADPPPKKAVDTFGQRTSIYRGVTR